MTRKRFKKLLMSRGYGRRSAEVIAFLEWLLCGNYAKSWANYLRDDEAVRALRGVGDPQGPQGVGPYEGEARE